MFVVGDVYIVVCSRGWVPRVFVAGGGCLVCLLQVMGTSCFCSRGWIPRVFLGFC